MILKNNHYFKTFGRKTPFFRCLNIFCSRGCPRKNSLHPKFYKFQGQTIQNLYKLSLKNRNMLKKNRFNTKN